MLVVGHPYVDIWQAVRPAALGIDAWPDVPRGRPWKEGVCAALGWPADAAARPGGASSARCAATPTWNRPCSGRVEELIDFVTVDAPHP